MLNKTSMPNLKQFGLVVSSGAIVGRKMGFTSCNMKKPVMGHSLIRPLVHSHRSLVHSLAHSLAPELLGQSDIFVQFSKCFESLCRLLSAVVVPSESNHDIHCAIIPLPSARTRIVHANPSKTPISYERLQWLYLSESQLIHR